MAVNDPRRLYWCRTPAADNYYADSGPHGDPCSLRDPSTQSYANTNPGPGTFAHQPANAYSLTLALCYPHLVTLSNTYAHPQTYFLYRWS